MEDYLDRFEGIATKIYTMSEYQLECLKFIVQLEILEELKKLNKLGTKK